MNPIVLYSSRGGNAQKVAEEIASELNCQCIKIAKDSASPTVNLNDFDLVFVGSGVYAGKPNMDMLNYLSNMSSEGKRQFAFFLTWFGRGTSDKPALEKMKEAIEAKGPRTVESCYKCQGEGHTAGTRFVSRLIGHNANGHPNAEELSAARAWAKELAKTV